MWLRRIRAALVIGTLWGMFWGAMTLLLFYVMLQEFSPSQQERVHQAMALLGSVLAGAFALGGAMGLVTGMCFSLLLAALERRSDPLEWNTLRFVLWGTLAALGIVSAVMVVTGLPLPMLFVCVIGFCGAESALYTVYVARRAPDVVGAGNREAVGQGIEAPRIAGPR